MTVKECYSCIGADYGDVLKRLGTDERICKFLGMLLRDPNYSLLVESLEKEDYKTAFRAVHTLKGISMNLSMTRLTEVSVELTEVLRPQEQDDRIQPLFQQIKQTYEEMTTAITTLLG